MSPHSITTTTTTTTTTATIRPSRIDTESYGVNKNTSGCTKHSNDDRLATRPNICDRDGWLGNCILIDSFIHSLNLNKNLCGVFSANCNIVIFAFCAAAMQQEPKTHWSAGTTQTKTSTKTECRFLPLPSSSTGASFIAIISSIRFLKVSHPIVHRHVNCLAESLPVTKGFQYGSQIRIVRLGHGKVGHVVTLSQRAGAINIRKPHRPGCHGTTGGTGGDECPVHGEIEFVQVAFLAANGRHTGVSRRHVDLGHGQHRVVGCRCRRGQCVRRGQEGLSESIRGPRGAVLFL